jgi:hypothetical protein
VLVEMKRNKTACGNKRSEGGRRKVSKTRKGSSWTRSVTKLYHEMKRKDKNVQFRDALKEASRLKKQGKL